MICKDHLPLNTTDKEGFKHFMHIVAPMYKIPARTSITSMIDEKYEILSKITKSRLLEVTSLSITTDIWTETKNTTSFLGVTCHYLWQQKLKTLTIGLVELSERHNAEYLSNELKKICDEWNIKEEKIVAVITDNGANIVKAVAEMFGKNKHIPCFAHTLDLVAQKIFEKCDNLKKIIENVKRIVTYFKHCVQATDELRKAQSGKVALKLIQSCPTRWNSTFYMLERFLKLCEYVAPILISHTNAPDMISGAEKHILLQVIQVLKPIEKASKEVSGEQYLTASKIIPIINCLNKEMEHLELDNEHAISLKNAVILELQKRFGAVEQVKLLAVTTILDPRFKKIHFNNANACAQAIIHLQSSYKNLVKSTSTENSPIGLVTSVTTKSESLWVHHEKLAIQSKTINEISEKNELCFELKNYLNSSVIPLTSNPVEYWNSQTNEIFKQLANKYFSIVGTSVPSERLFSKAGHILSESRNRLHGKRLSKLLFLNSLEVIEWLV